MEFEKLIFCGLDQGKKLKPCIRVREMVAQMRGCHRAFLLLNGEESGLGEGLPPMGVGEEIDCSLREAREG
jgi:hypothetical protein